MSGETAPPLPFALGHRLVRADAGAGKTYSLAVRYLALLASGSAPERILAATFTRKAAGEILERILVRLARAASDADEAARLSRDLAEEGAVAAPRDTQAFVDMLARLCANLHRLQVGTLDAFLHRVTLAFRFELGLPVVGAVTAAEDPALASLRLVAIERALDELASDGEEALVELLGRLYRGDAQRSVASALDRVVLEVYETYRLASEASAWRSLEVPGQELSPLGLAEAIDALCDEAAALEGAVLGAVSKDLGQARRGDWLGFLADGPAAKVAEDPGSASYRRQPLPSRLVRAYRPLIEHARWDLLDRLARQTEATHAFVATFDRQFERLRRARGVVLFSDFSRLLTAHLAVLDDEAILGLFYRLDSRVEHLLLDEFQDTSREQWLALAWLADEILAWGDGSRTLYCVGDPKQSIYVWRGGCAELFDEVESRLSGGALDDSGSSEQTSPAVRRLGVSYRSSPIVLDVVDAVFSGLERNRALADGAPRREAARWVKSYERHRAAAPEQPGWVRLVTTGAWEGEFPPDAPARLGEDEADAPDEEGTEEARPVGHLAHAADRIAEVVARAGGGEGPIDPAELSVGVLTLTNRTAAELLALLRERGLEASGEGGGPLVDDPAVTAVLSALSLAAHPGDSAAAFHVARTPLGEVVGLEESSWRRAGEGVARRIRTDVLERGPAAVLTEWARALRSVTSRRSGARLAQLVELAEAHEREGLGGPFDLVARARAVTLEEPSPAAVRVMTVHRAKGLEFDVVVLPELERRLGDLNNPLALVDRPSATGPIAAVVRGTNKIVRSCSERLEEVHSQEVARRVADDLGVLYVALTRARFELHLVVQPSSPGRAGRANFAELLRHALAAERREVWGEGGTALYEKGSAVDLLALREGRVRASGSHRSEGDVPEEEPERVSRSIPRLPLERPSRLAVGAGGASRVDELLRLEPALERSRGVLMHAWLREVEWLPSPGAPERGHPDQEAAWRLARAVTPGVGRETVATWHAEILRALEAPEVAAIFARPRARAGTYRLWRERPFALVLGGRLVRGVLDRAIVWEDRGTSSGVELYELKSDRVGSSVEAVVARHRDQVRAYAEAVASMLGLLPTAVRASLVLLDAGRVVAVEP